MHGTGIKIQATCFALMN